MKRITANALSMMALVLLFTAASYAQDVQVTVPFEFTAGDTTFPAGEYRLTVAENHVLTLSNRDLGSGVFTMTAYSISSLTRSKSGLEFQFQDGRAALTEVWVSGGIGYGLYKAKKPAVLAQNTPAATAQQ